MSLQKRPWRLILVTSFVALFQLGALLRSLTLPPELAEQLSLQQPLEPLASGLWALIFARLAVNLVRGGASRWLPWAYAGFIIYTVLRLLIFAQADYDQSRRPFIVLAMLFMLTLLVAWSRHR